MINYKPGPELFSSLRIRAENALNRLVEKSEQEKRVSTKNLKKCLKDVENSPLKLPIDFLSTCQENLFNVLANQKTKKFEKKSSLIKQIIISSKLKQSIKKEDIEPPVLQKENVIAQPVAAPRKVALSHAGSRLSKVNSRISEKTISPGSSSEIHSIDFYDNDNQRIEPAKKEVLAEPGENCISVVNDGFSKIYTKHLNEARDKIDTMIKKYQKSEEIDVTRNLDEIYDNQETILYLLKRIPKEESDLKKQEKIASIKEYQSKIGEGLNDTLSAIDSLGSAQNEFIIDAKLTRNNLIYALNDSYDALDRLNLPSQQAN
ncbi:hypothetical protein [Kalamiella sp. sgz302252]|uniref:hypothetical protein n=1 Tax=Pantoea sp. sgz302252 TaxID=3341827 RepID=UPI0036D3FAB3